MSSMKSAGRKCGRPETDENASNGPAEAPAGVANEFELARLRRIQRNKQMLAELGLENAAGSLLGESSKQGKQRAAKRQHRQGADGEQQQQQEQQLQPTRRSRRLASQPAEAAPEHQLEFQELGPGGCSRQVSTEQRRRVCSSAAASKLEPSAHHQHNMHRLNSMSEKALITRAWKITNVSKLKSFVQVLVAAGMEAVLQEARDALQQLTGSCS